MSENTIQKLKYVEKLIANKLPSKTRHTIVLNPNDRNYDFKPSDGIVYDKASWNLPEDLKYLVKELSNNLKLSSEMKILKFYEKICTNYVYDDNLISYIQKVDDDKFSVPDWYGRDVDEEWQKNREKHNRRVCFELARYMATGLTELFKNDSDYDVGIFWNKELTHYLVGLTCNNYSLALDPDDFFNIKDLTRIKTGLTALGIVVLEDKAKVFTKYLNKFNKNRDEFATMAMENEIANENNQEESEDASFFRKSVEILVSKKGLDSQGIFEYVKEMADIKLGSDCRTKLYRKISGETEYSTQLIRCLLLKIDEKEYLVDGYEGVFREFDKKEFEGKTPKYAPCKNVTREPFDYYDGR